MNDDIVSLFYSKEPICEEGRMYLVDRCLSIPEALKKGICSKNGYIYFLYQFNGKIVRWKARSLKDKKKQFMSKLDVEDESTFKMPFFSQFKASPLRYLVITEGEFDCIALSQLGASNCVSLPNGAQSVETTFKNHYEFLQEFDEIFIAFDMDRAGDEAAKKALKMISPRKYRRINFPCKDANDWLKEYSPEPEDFEKLMANAERVHMPALTNVRDLPKSFYDSIDLGASTGWFKLDEILGGMRKGEVTVLTADTGAGKSTFSINLMMNLAKQGKNVWINSYELDPRIVNRKMANFVLQKKMKFKEFTDEEYNTYINFLEKYKCHANISPSKVDIETLRNQFEMASLAYNMEYVLIDHLDYIHAGGKKSSVLENIDDAMREIHSLAMEFNLGVVLVVHPKQVPDGKEISMSDLKGSSSIKQYADNIIILSRMDRFEPTDKLRIKVRVSKNRLVGVEAFFYLRYVPESDGYTESF